MNTRRGFIRATLALLAGAVVPGRWAKGSNPQRWAKLAPVNCGTWTDRSYFVSMIPLGGPGIPGITYFRAGDHLLPDGVRIFLNGEDITNVCGVVDLSEGWAGCYRHRRRPDGSIEFVRDETGVASYVAKGEIELRPQPSVQQLVEQARLNGHLEVRSDGWIRQHPKATEATALDALHSRGAWKQPEQPGLSDLTKTLREMEADAKQITSRLGAAQ